MSSAKTLVASCPAVRLPPDAMDAINSAPATEVGGRAAVEAWFGYRPTAPTPVVTQEQRALIAAEVKAQLLHWHTFKELAPGAYEQTKIRVLSDTFQVRCLDGHIQDYAIVYNPPFAGSHESGFSLRWVECSFMCVEQNYSLNKKRVDDRFASLIANIAAVGFAWH